MIVSSAVKLTNNQIFVGKRHGDCFSAIMEIYKNQGIYEYEQIRRLHFNCTQGFINDKLEFLTREEAYYKAVSCGQYKEKNNLHESKIKPCLYSEDLW